MVTCDFCGGDVHLAEAIMIYLQDRFLRGHDVCVSLVAKEYEKNNGFMEGKSGVETKSLLGNLTFHIEQIEKNVKFDHEEIDKFVNNGNDIKHAIIANSFLQLSGLKKVLTKHGFVRCFYSSYIPSNSMVLICDRYE